MKALSRKLYLLDNKNEQDIARHTGETVDTIISWVRQGGWQHLRDDANAIPAAIAGNIGCQIIDFQKAIQKRKEEGCVMTADEIRQQATLVSNYNTFKRHPGKALTIQVLMGFMHYVAEEDETLSERVMELYQHYVGRQQKAQPKTAPQATSAPKAAEPVTPTQPPASPRPAEPLPVADINPFLSEKKEYTTGQRPPFTGDAFEQNKAMLHNYAQGDKNSMVLFEGRMVKKGWLEYNLLQYYLPIEQRRFIADENTYPIMVNHADTVREIRRFYDRTRAA